MRIIKQKSKKSTRENTIGKLLKKKSCLHIKLNNELNWKLNSNRIQSLRVWLRHIPCPQGYAGQVGADMQRWYGPGGRRATHSPAVGNPEQRVYFNSLKFAKDVPSFNPDNIGGGAKRPCDAKFSENCPCSHNNNTAFMKQISLFDTAIVMTNT